MLGEATAALARLDLAGLEELERRAVALQALVATGTRIQALPETLARFRVFAGALQATGENLAIIERLLGPGMPWAR